MRIILLIVLFLGGLEAVPNSVKNKSKKFRYTLSVCSVFKNEEKYLKEWIEYHRIIGVDHFYLYNNNSIDSFRRIVFPFVKSGVVTLIDWPDNWKNLTEENAYLWNVGTQIPAYENAINLHAVRETEWLVFLDVDEYLVIANGADTLSDILYRYRDGVGILLPCEYFDASDKGDFPPRRLLIETRERVEDPQQDLMTTVIKMIFKPSQSKGFSWPPYHPSFLNFQFPVPCRENEFCINRYMNKQNSVLNNKKPPHVSHPFFNNSSRERIKWESSAKDMNSDITRFVPQVLSKMVD